MNIKKKIFSAFLVMLFFVFIPLAKCDETLVNPKRPNKQIKLAALEKRILDYKINDAYGDDPYGLVVIKTWSWSLQWSPVPCVLHGSSIQGSKPCSMSPKTRRGAWSQE